MRIIFAITNEHSALQSRHADHDEQSVNIVMEGIRLLHLIRSSLTPPRLGVTKNMFIAVTWKLSMSKAPSPFVEIAGNLCLMAFSALHRWVNHLFVLFASQN